MKKKAATKKDKRLDDLHRLVSKAIDIDGEDYNADGWESKFTALGYTEEEVFNAVGLDTHRDFRYHYTAKQISEMDVLLEEYPEEEYEDIAENDPDRWSELEPEEKETIREVARYRKAKQGGKIRVIPERGKQ